MTVSWTFLMSTVASATAEAAALPALRELAPKGLFIGAEFNSNVMFGHLNDSATYRKVHSAQYSLSGTYCGWQLTEPQQGKFNMDVCTKASEYAVSVGQAVRFTNLCWNGAKFNPDWLNALRGAEQMAAALRAHHQAPQATMLGH